MAHNKDWLEWLSALNASEVEYVIVGGVALAHHGHPRYTGDLDLLVNATPQNAERILKALREFGMGSLKIGVADLSCADKVIQLGFPPGRIDLLTTIDGVTWDEVFSRAERGTYGEVPTRFISRRDLIANKKASGRPQDVADAHRLEQG